MMNALAPAGPQAAHIASLWWVMLGACVLVFVVILAALGLALWRSGRGDAATAPRIPPSPAEERRASRPVAALVALAGLMLAGLLAASILTDRALAQLPLDGAIQVKLTANQWWWDVQYDDARPDRIFQTANELRIPVGRPVIIQLQSRDVIHSFWVPSLHGKKDLIPGRTSLIRLRADAPGRYRGRCAEYCGMQHAFMDLDVVALPGAEYEAWAEAQRRSPAPPQDAVARRGQQLFLSGSCMLCHAVQGTPAQARAAPDLTHVASRAHLAAGRLANTPENLAAWIADPQKFKPGTPMPAHPLPAEDLGALVAYLETLK